LTLLPSCFGDPVVFYVVKYLECEEIHEGFSKLRPSMSTTFGSAADITIGLKIVAKWTDGKWYHASVVSIHKKKPRIAKERLRVKFAGDFQKESKVSIFFFNFFLLSSFLLSFPFLMII